MDHGTIHIRKNQSEDCDLGAADDAVSTGQEYQMGGRRLTRVDAEFIEKKLDWLYAQKNKIVNRTGRIVAMQGRVAR